MASESRGPDGQAPRRRPLLRVYLKVLLLYTPTLTTFALLGFGYLSSFGAWLHGMVVSGVTTTCCFWGVVLCHAAADLVRRRRRWPLPDRGPMQSFLLAILLLPLALPLALHLGAALSPWLGYRASSPDLASYRFSIVVGALACGVFFTFEMQRAARLAKQSTTLRLERAENERLKAQLAALAAQLNPHLLFNALNTIASLIHTRPETAEEMTVQLAELLRGVLAACQREVHPLADEIALCRNYLEIEAVRFGPRLRIRIEVDPEVDPRDVRVPVLVLQPLVENAIKYAIAPRSEGGEVAIGIERRGKALRLTVEDDGPGMGRSSARPGAGIGLACCRSRLELSGRGGRLEVEGGPAGGGTRVTVVLPDREDGVEGGN